MFFRQINDKDVGDNFSYVLGDESTKEVMVVDPGFNGDDLSYLLVSLRHRLKVKYAVVTHHHQDHAAGVEWIKTSFGGEFIAHELSPFESDIELRDGDTIKVGSVDVLVIHTPGHTPDGICLLANNKLLTGDTLFVGECGRTDLPDSNIEDMYNSLFNKLMKLDDDIEVYPGHDYGSMRHSTIGHERKNNYTLEQRTLEEFKEFMKEP